MPLMHTAMFGAPPVSGFDPTTVAGCELYLRSDLGVTLSGSTVTAWADQSGNGRNATPVGSPTQVTNVQNGFPSVHFNGTSQYFTLASSAMGGANWTVFAVFKSSAIASTQTVYGEALSPSKSRRLYLSGSNVVSFTFDAATSAQAIDPTTLATGTCYVATATSADSNPNIAYVNGDAGTSASGTLTAFTPATWTVGALFTSSAILLFAGDLLAVIVYNNALSSTNRTSVRDGLKTLYAAY